MFTHIAKRFMNEAQYLGPLLGATVRGMYGEVGGGPYMIIELGVASGVISHAAYQTYGCPSAMACGALVCHLAIGKTPERLRSLTSKDILAVLGGLPEGKEHCSEMAIYALGEALSSAS